MDISKLTLREKIGQTMMLENFDTYCEKFGGIEAFLKKYPIGSVYVGGAIVGDKLFGKDAFYTPITEASKYTTCPVLFGGDMACYIKNGKLSRMPSLMNLGATDDLKLAYEYGRAFGCAAAAAGVSWIFTPVADLNVNPENQIILTRSIGDNPKRAAEMICEVVRGIQDCGVAATLKHFPGLGSENVDSHLAPVELPLSKEEWDSSVRVVYEEVIQSGLASVMTAHVSLPPYQTAEEDGTYGIATLSKEITQTLLKDELGFDGVVVTDALAMGGFSGSSVEMEIQSFLAGSDVLLWPSLAYMDVLEKKILSGEISEERLDDAVRRVLALKERVGLFNKKPPAAELSFDEEIAQKVAEKSITLLNNKRSLLPLDQSKVKKVLLVAVSPYERHETRLPIIKKIQELLEKRGIEVVFQVDAWRNELAANKDCDINLFVIDRVTGIYQGSKDVYGENAASVWGSHISDKDKTIVATFGNPYIYAKYYKTIEHYVNAYDLHDEVIKAFDRALFGEIPFVGKSPIELKSYYKK